MFRLVKTFSNTGMKTNTLCELVISIIAWYFLDNSRDMIHLLVVFAGALLIIILYIIDIARNKKDSEDVEGFSFYKRIETEIKGKQKELEELRRELADIYKVIENARQD
jgi:hypothetical protein